MKTSLLLALVPGLALAGTVVEPKLSFTAEERYDHAFAAGDPEVMTKFVPRAGVTLRSRTFDSEAWYSPDLQLRHTARNQLRVDHRGGLELRKRLSPLTSVSSRAQLWRVSDPTSLPRMGLGTPGFRGTILYGTAEAGLEAMLSARVTSALRYRFEGAYFFGQEAATPSAVQSPSAEVWYRATPRASVGLEYRFQHFIFSEQQTTSHSPAVLFRYRLSPLTTFNARGGPVWYRADGTPNLLPRVHLELARDDRRFDYGVQAGQDLAGANGYSAAQYAQYAGLYTGWRLTDVFRLFGGAYLFRSGAADAPGAWRSPSADALGYAVGVGAEWRFHPRLMLQAQLDRVDQFGEVAEAYTRNIAAVRLVVTAW